MSVQHFPATPLGGGLTIANKTAYFSGISAPGAGSIADQTREIIRKYDAMFKQHGLLKKNMLYLTAFMKNPDLEKEFLDVYFEWMEEENPTAGATVQGMPVQPKEGDVDLVLSLIVAADPEAKIERIDAQPGGARAVVYNGIAYFTGHIWPNGGTLTEHVAGVLTRYDEQFERLGIRRENVLFSNAFISNIGEFNDEFEGISKAWYDFFGDNAPAGIFVQARPNHSGKFGDGLKIELAMFAVVGDAKVEHIDPEPGIGNNRLVKYGNMAYFAGHRARPEFKSLKAQTEGLLPRYEELFAQFGLKKENLVMTNCYLRDVTKYEEFAEPYAKWCEGHVPADICVQAIAPTTPNETDLELQFFVAID